MGGRPLIHDRKVTGALRRSALLVSLVVTALVAAAPATAQVPPDARWRTFDTEHFRVTFPDGLEQIARRAADRAEKAYVVLSTELADPPRGRIDLVVSDNMDLANGYATVIPTNRVVVYAHPPVEEPSLAYYEDWLQLVVLHELVHIFHLDSAEGVWDRLRTVFGRSPALFPQFFSPGWLLEGLATAYESRFTPAGRVRGTHYDMILRTAVLEGELFGIDRATSDPIRWPASTSRYAYGAYFLDHLARRYGPERVAGFLREYGGRWVPYRVDSAARAAFGISFTRAWQEWADSLETHYAAEVAAIEAAGATTPELLTSHGRGAVHPRYSPDGAAIAYSAATGLDEPALRLILPHGDVVDVHRRSTTGPSAWMPDGRHLLTAQHERADPFRIYADLYRVGVSGEAERLTRAERVWDPDVHPDGETTVVVAHAPGTNVLALHDLATGETRPITAPSLDVHWSLPRWSPDGGTLAVARWSRGGLYDVVLVDTTGTVLRQLTRDRAIDSGPTWSPDGRYVVFASDRTGISNLYAYDLLEGMLHQVTNLVTGALHPDVSPDGRWIVFSLYGADGFNVARIPFEPASWRPAPPVRAEVARPLPAFGYDDVAGGPVRAYSPFPTVLPAAWSLILEGGTDLGLGIGAGAFGSDVVERHVWHLDAAVFPEDRRVGAEAGYRYRGLGNPVLELTASQRWGVRSALGEIVVRGDTVQSALLRRDRGIRAEAAWLRARWWSASWLEAGLSLDDLDFVWDRPEAADAAGVSLREFPLDLGATVTGGYTTARAYGVSIGPQEGVSVTGRLEGHRYLEPLAGDAFTRGYGRATARGRLFHPLRLPGIELPGFARHVLALRVDGGVETGSRSPGFAVGGASSGTTPVPLEVDLFGTGIGFPVRGYPAGVQEGNRALSAAAEYRFPIALVERGFRLVPLYLGRVWGDVFVDAGSAWCGGGTEDCALRIGGASDRPRPLYSAGAEIVAHLKVGFLADLPLRVGTAVPLTDTGGSREPVLYLRLGRSF